MFIHYTSIEGDVFICLRNGQVVEYEEIASDKGLQGKDVTILEVEAAAEEQEVVEVLD